MTLGFVALGLVLLIEFLGIDRLKFLPLPIIVLLLGYVCLAHKPAEYLGTRQAKLSLFFIALTGLALVHGFVRGYALEPFQQQFGYFLLGMVAYFLIDSRRRIDQLAVLLVGMFGYLCLLNFPKFFGARTGTFDAGYFLGDGNDFAWGLNFVLPFALYLFMRYRSVLMRVPVAFAGLLMVYGITGTQSRGASLALVAAILYLWLVASRRKLQSLVVICLVGSGLLVVAPAAYFQRMETVAHYEEDSSAMARVRAWGAAMEMAIDHPLLGVGAGSYNSAYGRNYRGDDDPRRWISTHSVYFRILGEYGFVGLIVFVWLVASNFFTNLRTRRLLLAHPQIADKVPAYLPDMINMSLVGYATAAMFLSGVGYPYIFLLTALTLAAARLVRRELPEDEPAPAPDGSIAVDTGWGRRF